MASIKISELRPAGSELFQDSESFLDELNEQEMTVVSGGRRNKRPLVESVVTVISQFTVSQGISIASVSVVSIND